MRAATLHCPANDWRPHLYPICRHSSTGAIRDQKIQRYRTSLPLSTRSSDWMRPRCASICGARDAGVSVYIGRRGAAEGNTLTRDERDRVLAIAVEELKGKVPVALRASNRTMPRRWSSPAQR